MEEMWKPVLGFEGLYEISNLGRVNRLKRVIRQKARVMQNHTLKEMFLKIQTNIDGYYVVKLSKNGRVYEKRINRLIAEAFIPNPKNLPVVNHKDTIKTNNSVSNLEWCTVAHNNRHAFANNLMNHFKGEEYPGAKLNVEKIKYIRKKYKAGKTQKELAELFQICQQAVSKIIHRKLWGHI